MEELGLIWRDNLRFFLPELVLTATILLTALADVIFRARRETAVRIVAVAGLLAALGLACFDRTVQATLTGNLLPIDLFAGLIAHDALGAFFRILVIAVTLVAVLAAFASREMKRAPFGEFLVLILAVTLGMVLLAKSVNLLMLYLALELISIPSYALVAYLRGDRIGKEAALKYILIGALSTGTMLYGIGILFGITGSFDLQVIGKALFLTPMSGMNQVALLLGGILALAGFGFKIAAVPFHFWAPDVYTGAPTPVAAFLTVGPKAAGFAALLRFFLLSLGGEQNVIGFATGVDWRAVLIALAVLTMTVGNLAAFFQDNLKRLLGYSSIAHAGFMLMGVVAMSEAGVKGVLVYLAIYLFMNLGAFLVVIFLHNQSGSVDIEGLRGIARSSPLLAGAMVILVLSLMGIPPFAGFWAKYYVFWAVIEQNLIWLAVAGAVNAVFGYFYYARILKAMYLEQPTIKAEGEEEPQPVRLRPTPFQWALLALLVIPNLLFVWPFWAPLDRFAQAATSLLGIVF